jgi:hypothetical protein
MSAQLHLFAFHDPRPRGIKVSIEPCKCGCKVGTVGPGKAMHAAEIRCSTCVGFVRWLSKHELAIVTQAAKSPHAPAVIPLPSRGENP